jgi:hypothetical protein
VPDVTKLLLSLHVLAAIIAIGPVTVAASMFPAVARLADLAHTTRTAPNSEAVPADGTAPNSEAVADDRMASSSEVAPAGRAVLDAGSRAVAGSHGETGSHAESVNRDGAGERLRLLHRICRVYGVVGVAVPVFGLATASSLGVLGDAWLLTSIVLTVAAALILGLLIIPGQQRALVDGRAGRLGMYTGIFNLLWATVTVLMIVRPGSTTGA